jgi:competence protein ComEC
MKRPSPTWLGILPGLVWTLAGCDPGLVLDSVTPGSIYAGAAAPLTVEGGGFAPEMTLSLAGPGIDAPLGGLEVRDPHRAEALTPATLPAGTYDLVAHLGDASAQLEGALEVLDGYMRVVAIDVGQGDATLVVAPGGETLLVDGGPRGSAADLRAALDTHAAGRLDAVILTHHDADHLGGLVDLLAGPDGTAGSADDLLPDLRFDPGGDEACTSATCDRYRQLGAHPFDRAQVGGGFELGAVQVHLVASGGELESGFVSGATDDNERSVAALVTYGGKTLLLTGDLTGGGAGTADVETPLAQLTGPVDVLHVSHHGSQTSSPQGALELWQPQWALLSLGTDNTYCHPHPEVMARLSATGATILATGAGIVADGDRCGHTTSPSAGALGLSTFSLDVFADGRIEQNGQGATGP